MRRFFISPERIREGRVHIEGAEFRHAVKSLRLKAGEMITIIDGQSEYAARLESVSGKSAEALILTRGAGDREPSCEIILCQALIKGPRFEIILEKATELGATRIIPLMTARSITGGPGKERHDRWERILQSAACQCGRVTVPTLAYPLSFSKALDACHTSLGLIFSPSAPLVPLSRVVPAALSSAALFLGPEGGFSPGELQDARERGLHQVSLGKRILRAETAAIASLAIVLHELEILMNPMER